MILVVWLFIEGGASHCVYIYIHIYTYTQRFDSSTCQLIGAWHDVISNGKCSRADFADFPSERCFSFGVCMSLPPDKQITYGFHRPLSIHLSISKEKDVQYILLLSSPNISPPKKNRSLSRSSSKNRWIQPSPQKGRRGQQQTTNIQNPTVLAGEKRCLKEHHPGW